MDTASSTAPDTRAELAALQQDVKRLVDEVQRVVVGQDIVIQGVITCLLAGGHGLLEGVPGLGKTLLIRTLAQAVDLQFSRIEFTPDLMPADIVGTSVMVTEERTKERRLQYEPGPIFSNIVLADEINRATPKTQSALLEAMAEGTVTAAGSSRKLPEPFLVLATQNPLEMEGTYPLPEAQLDRFLFKIQVDFPSEDELIAILNRTTGQMNTSASPTLDAARILEMRTLLRAMPVAPSLTSYVVRVLRATHPPADGETAVSDLIGRYVRYGGSPRGAQAMLLAARVRCAVDGRLTPSIDDVRAVAPSALRHRMILNFEGEAEGINVNDCINEVLKNVSPDPA